MPARKGNLRSRIGSVRARARARPRGAWRTARARSEGEPNARGHPDVLRFYFARISIALGGGYRFREPWLGAWRASFRGPVVRTCGYSTDPLSYFFLPSLKPGRRNSSQDLCSIYRGRRTIKGVASTVPNLYIYTSVVLGCVGTRVRGSLTAAVSRLPESCAQLIRVRVEALTARD